ncbi:MAG: archaellin/type IV pilin N-terminal domain-containing protein [Candidatus Bathyarchaeota archaeon]
MSINKLLGKRRGMTGLETAIILVAFVITAAAFAFVVLNMGFLTAEKAQSVISSGMSEASSALLVDSGVIGQFGSTGGDQAAIDLEKLTFYIKLSQGHEPIDLDDSKLVATYTNARVHGEIYNANGTVMTIYGVNDDGDSLCETGEKFRVEVNFTELLYDSMVDPTPASQDDVYAHPYEEFRIELRPSAGAVLTIERQLPAVYTAIMTLE